MSSGAAFVRGLQRSRANRRFSSYPSIHLCTYVSISISVPASISRERFTLRNWPCDCRGWQAQNLQSRLDTQGRVDSTAQFRRLPSAECPLSGGRGPPFPLKSSTDWVRPTYIGAGHLLYSESADWDFFFQIFIWKTFLQQHQDWHQKSGQLSHVDTKSTITPYCKRNRGKRLRKLVCSM